MKYVMLLTKNGQKLPVIFPDCLTHQIMGLTIAAVIETQFRIPAVPVNAGFVSLGLDVETSGDSESLKLSSQPSDAARIMVGDSISFMPDPVAEQMLSKLKERK